MLSKKSTIPVVIFAFSATLLLMIIGVRSDLFQSSLLGNSGSGINLSESASGMTMETTVNEAEDLKYRTALLSAYNSVPGLYFPHVYDIPEVDTIVSIPLAYKGVVPLSIESKMVIEMTYPSFLSYVGEATYMKEDAAYTVENDPVDRTMIVTVSAREPMVLAMDISSLMELDFAVTDSQAEKGAHTFTMTEAYTIDTQNQRNDVAFVKEPVGIFANVILTSTDESSSRDVITEEPGRVVLSAEPTVPVNNTTVITNTVLPKPIVTTDQTRVSPRRAELGSGDTVFLYVSVSNTLREDEIEAVLVDLSEMGLGESLSMLLLEERDDYYVYATSFILPDEGVEEGIRSLPYQVINSDGGRVEGELEIDIISDVVTSDMTINVREENIVDIDLTKDGVVDADDLELFLDLYQRISGTR